MSRLETLRAMLSQDSGNTLARYGLAMELANQGQLDEAVTEYGALLERDPNYAAAYYHGGQALERLGRIDDAREWYERGIQVTGRNGDAHTQSELQAALDLLPI
jgi:tetratricopeptide (TPR) repeat protein